MRPLRLTARWALPIDGAAIPGAAILIGADGRIDAVGPDATVPVPPDARTRDLGEAILLPGLVNAHTHLELTGYEDLTPDRPFREWILAIRERKLRRSAAEFLDAARGGIKDCWAGGVTTIAETGDSGVVLEALAELGGSGIVYHEVFGPHPGQLEESFQGLRARVAELAPRAVGRVRLGVSPHAPYTVSGPLYSRVAEWARAEKLPIAVHIAESAEESEFVTRGTGPFADAWRARGIPHLDDPAERPSACPPVRLSLPSSLSSPIQWLDAQGILGPDTLCIHAVQLSPDDIRTIAARGAAVAHCPLSNRRHRHGDAPLAALLRAGIRVGVGTDSVASVGRLDLLAEARAARSLGDLSAEAALGLATLDAARALGLEAEIGSLTRGKWGDVVALAASPRPPGEGSGPAELALGASPSDTLLTVLAGRVVFEAEPRRLFGNG